MGIEWEDREFHDAGTAFDEQYRLDMKREAAMDDYEDACDSTCSSCGKQWVMGTIPATRYQPSEPAQPECPYCGGDALEDE